EQGIKNAECRQRETDDKAEAQGSRGEGNKAIEPLVYKRCKSVLRFALFPFAPGVFDADRAAAAFEGHQPHEGPRILHSSHRFDNTAIDQLEITDAGRQLDIGEADERAVVKPPQGPHDAAFLARGTDAIDDFVALLPVVDEAWQ